MKKFLLLYISPMSAEAQMFSPEEMEKRMEPWNAWQKKYAKAIVDFGAPLGAGTRTDKKGNSKSQSQVRGYSIVQANDMEAVKAMLTNHPHLMTPEASIESLEMIEM